MSEERTVRRSLRTKFAAIVLCLIALSLVLIVGNLYLLAKVQGDASSMAVLAGGRARCFEQLYLVRRLAQAPADERAPLITRIRASIKAVDQRPKLLRD